MRKIDLTRRRLTFNNPISGTLAFASGTDSVTIKDSAGVSFNTLVIKGKTRQPIPNRGKQYHEYVTSVKSYVPAGLMGYYMLRLPDEWIGATITYSLTELNKMTGITVSLSNGANPLFASTYELLSKDGTLNTYTGSEYSHLLVSGVWGEDVEDENGDVIHVLTELTQLWQSYELSAIAPICFEIETPILSSGDEGMILTLDLEDKKKTYEIPKSIALDGKEIPLLMSEYDTLYVDLKKRKVIYEEGSYLKTYSGKELFWVHDWAMKEGYGIFYTANAPVAAAAGVGYCTHATVANWDPPRDNYKYSIDTSYIEIKTNQWDKGLTIEQQNEFANEFKAKLAEKYEKGHPLKILIKRASPIEHDITKTELGRLLLSLSVPRGQDGTVSVGSSLGISSIEASYYSSSEDKEEKVTLEIRYLNEAGTEIGEARTHKIRLGSKYQIVAPHIDGYNRVSSEVWGVADADCTINLIYKEAK